MAFNTNHTPKKKPQQNHQPPCWKTCKHFDSDIMRYKWYLNGQMLKLLLQFCIKFYRHEHITRLLSRQEKLLIWFHFYFVQFCSVASCSPSSLWILKKLSCISICCLISKSCSLSPKIYQKNIFKKNLRK